MALQASRADLDARHGLAAESVPYWRLVARRFRRNRLAVAGLVVLLCLGLMSLLAPYISPYPPEQFDLRAGPEAPPSPEHWLGTDHAARDNLSRLLWGGRVSYTLALAALGISTVVGAVLGAVAGYYGGWVDSLIMRLVDMTLTVPDLLLILTITALWGSGMTQLVVAIVFVSWQTPARLVRGQFLSLREQDFVQAAHAAGAPAWRVMVRHMLPNAMAPLIVHASFGTAAIILLEAALSFLGLGVKEPTPTWGNMLHAAQNVAILKDHPWQWVPPGLMVFLSVLAINFVGDGLRDALDPRLKQ